jgi:hypothetical protein
MGGAYLNLALSTTVGYHPPTGHVSSAVQAEGELPGSSGTALKLYARTAAAIAANRTITFSLLKRSGVTTTTVLTCTIPNSGSSCNSGATSGTFADGDSMVISVVANGAIASVDYGFTFQYRSP